jgi:hypothetical protein
MFQKSPLLSHRHLPHLWKTGPFLVPRVPKLLEFAPYLPRRESSTIPPHGDRVARSLAATAHSVSLKSDLFRMPKSCTHDSRDQGTNVNYQKLAGSRQRFLPQIAQIGADIFDGHLRTSASSVAKCLTLCFLSGQDGCPRVAAGLPGKQIQTSGSQSRCQVFAASRQATTSQKTMECMSG